MIKVFKEHWQLFALFLVIGVLIGWVQFRQSGQSTNLDETRFQLTYDGQEVTNAAILDLGNSGFMIYIDYDGSLPILELEDGRKIPVTNSYDILNNKD